MVVRIRLARVGMRHRPFYTIVVINVKKARNAKPIEKIGIYDPIPRAQDGVKELVVKIDRVKFWLGHGAQPSDRVAYLLWRAGLLPAPPLPLLPKAKLQQQLDLQAGRAAAQTEKLE